MQNMGGRCKRGREVVKNGVWEREGGRVWRRSEKVRRECVEGGEGEEREWGVWEREGARQRSL